jgi:hypothetical protein
MNRETMAAAVFGVLLIARPCFAPSSNWACGDHSLGGDSLFGSDGACEYGLFEPR